MSNPSIASTITDLLAKLVSAADLPEPPPADPMPLLAAWLEDAAASGKYEDPGAMSLATATPQGLPSVRIVLCKSIEQARGELTFYTNYESRKGRELAANPRAAAVFHWPHAKRQARVEGTVRRLTEAQSDAYFASRPLLSRIGACISPQSRPIGSRGELLAAAASLARSAVLAGGLTRPPTWGGLALDLTAVELWSGRDGRLHQRVLWTRPAPDALWTATLLAP